MNQALSSCVESLLAEAHEQVQMNSMTAACLRLRSVHRPMGQVAQELAFGFRSIQTPCFAA